MGNIIKNGKALKSLKSLIVRAPFNLQEFKVGELGCCGDLWDGKAIIVREVKGVEIGELMWCIQERINVGDVGATKIQSHQVLENWMR